MDREGIVQVINEQKSHQSLLNEKKKIKDTKYMFYIYVIYVIDDIHKYMLYMICIFFSSVSFQNNLLALEIFTIW